jgi:hypothetical protein
VPGKKARIKMTAIITTDRTKLEQMAAALERIKAEFPEQTDELNVGIKALRRIWKRLDAEKPVSTVVAQAQEVVQKALEAPAQTEDAEEPIKDHAAQFVPNGFYTVVHPDKTHTTLRFRPHWDEAEAAKGVQAVSLLTGPDNESSYTGVAFVRGNKVFMWKKYKESTKVLHSINFLVNGGQVEAGETYAMVSGKCWKCNHKLTVPASLHRGLGPVCAKMLGLL